MERATAVGSGIGSEDLDFERVVRSLPGRADFAQIARTLVPPPRFREVRFSNYHPAHPSQAKASERLQGLAKQLARPARSPFSPFRRSRSDGSQGVYIDGGFGVGKTHLLAALWHELRAPAAYLTFDELMYFVGTAGVDAVGAAFVRHRLVAIDEWELDDPGNLKMAVAVVRRLVGSRTFVATTSNTLPLDLGTGRFSQKDFRAEIEELASAFEILTVGGADYRHRHFDRAPGSEYFLNEDELMLWKRGSAGPRVAGAPFPSLIQALASVHPIRYREVVRQIDALGVQRLGRLTNLSDALRWVHFVDSVYDGGVRIAATGAVETLADIFDESMLSGPYGKKLARCLSRLEELFADARSAVAPPIVQGDRQ